jgi:hypothetical protein
MFGCGGRHNKCVRLGRFRRWQNHRERVQSARRGNSRRARTASRFTKQPVVTYETQAGETLFGVQIKPQLNAVQSRPRDIVIVVDTSASQAGKYLTTSRLVYGTTDQ